MVLIPFQADDFETIRVVSEIGNRPFHPHVVDFSSVIEFRQLDWVSRVTDIQHLKSVSVVGEIEEISIEEDV